MKKTAIIFMLLTSLLLTACNVENSLETVPEDSKTVDTPTADATIEITNIYSEYLSFERCVNASTDIIKGKCVNIIENPDSVEYEFSVTKRLTGEDVKSNIFVYVKKNQSVSVISDETVEYETYELSARLPYQTGSEYYLLLSRYVSVYYDHDRYMVFNSTPFIPADDISQSKMYGESILEHSNMKTLTTEKEFLRYISSCIENIDKTDRPYYFGKPYTTETDLSAIINEADHVVKVKIQEQAYDGYTVKNKNIYRCTVTDSLKGEIQKDAVIQVTFFPDTVSVGDECILALDDSITNITPKHYNFSSKNSFFSLSDYDSIMEILNND